MKAKRIESAPEPPQPPGYDPCTGTSRMRLLLGEAVYYLVIAVCSFLAVAVVTTVIRINYLIITKIWELI
jgi:hypothetical protein